MISLLFICQDNVFRSMIAEAVAKRRLRGKDIPYPVSSAGLHLTRPTPHPILEHEMDLIGIDIFDSRAHEPQLLTHELLADDVIPIAMDPSTKMHIEDCYDRKAFLFNDVAFGESLSTQELYYQEDNPDLSEHELISYFRDVMWRIQVGMPKLLKAIPEMRAEMHTRPSDSHAPVPDFLKRGFD